MTDFIYCPRCSHPLEDRLIFSRLRPHCLACGFTLFREPKLAVGALVVHTGKILLIQRGVVPRIGYWAVPSGFVEADEQPRPALVREVAEETGLQVTVGPVLEVYPLADPEKQGVFLLFQAQYLDGHPHPGDDVSAVQWFSYAEIPWSHLAFAAMQDVLVALHQRGDLH